MTRQPLCPDCPDHEACASGYPCEVVKPATTHTPADPGADECAADGAGEWERDLSEYGVEL